MPAKAATSENKRGQPASLRKTSSFRPRGPAPNDDFWVAIRDGETTLKHTHVAKAVAYRGSPAPGGQCLHRPPPRISTPCHIGLHGWRPPFAPWEKNRQAKNNNTAFKISPYKLGGHPLQGLRPGAMAPPAPPPSARHWSKVTISLN